MTQLPLPEPEKSPIVIKIASLVGMTTAEVVKAIREADDFPAFMKRVITDRNMDINTAETVSLLLRTGGEGLQQFNEVRAISRRPL